MKKKKQSLKSSFIVVEFIVRSGSIVWRLYKRFPACHARLVIALMLKNKKEQLAIYLLLINLRTLSE